MKAFEYAAPESLDEAIALLGKLGDKAKVTAGGTDLMQRMKIGELETPDCIVSLGKLDDLSYINVADGGVTIGALATLSDVQGHEQIGQQYAVLADAAGSVGSPQIRNRATLVGNVCSASPAADAAVALVALDASVKVAGSNGEREVPMGDFLTGPRESCLRPGEVVTEILVPARGWSGSAYARSGLRRAMDCCVASAAAALTVDGDGAITDAHIVLGALAPTPIRVPQAEGALEGQSPSEELLAEVAAAASAAAQPIGDIRGSAEYRKELAGALARRAVSTAYQRAQSS
ncbi:MAG: xanthine dehydrogenase family protein subunit M [Armatimonadota bacterium]